MAIPYPQITPQDPFSTAMSQAAQRGLVQTQQQKALQDALAQQLQNQMTKIRMPYYPQLLQADIESKLGTGALRSKQAANYERDLDLRIVRARILAGENYRKLQSLTGWQAYGANHPEVNQSVVDLGRQLNAYSQGQGLPDPQKFDQDAAILNQHMANAFPDHHEESGRVADQYMQNHAQQQQQMKQMSVAPDGGLPEPTEQDLKQMQQAQQSMVASKNYSDTQIKNFPRAINAKRMLTTAEQFLPSLKKFSGWGGASLKALEQAKSSAGFKAPPEYQDLLNLNKLVDLTKPEIAALAQIPNAIEPLKNFKNEISKPLSQINFQQALNDFATFQEIVDDYAKQVGTPIGQQAELLQSGRPVEPMFTKESLAKRVQQLGGEGSQQPQGQQRGGVQIPAGKSRITFKDGTYQDVSNENLESVKRRLDERSKEKKYSSLAGYTVTRGR